MSAESPNLTRRVAASLAFGFLCVFGFALLAQAAVDFMNDVLGVPMRFLLPFGLKGILVDPDTLLDVASGLAILSLIVSGLFFVLIQRQRTLEQRRFWKPDDAD